MWLKSNKSSSRGGKCPNVTINIVFHQKWLEENFSHLQHV